MAHTTQAKSEYDLQAKKFVTDTGLKITKKYDGHRAYFEGDKDKRAVWLITFERDKRKPYTFTFGASINDSYRERKDWAGGPLHRQEIRREPTDYDLLACMGTYTPISFSDFCAEFGYDEDSRKAETTHRACLEQRAALEAMFSASELETLAEIR